MDDFKVTGADQFLRLSKSLKAAGELGLRKELNASLRIATKPLIAKTRAVAREELPKHGGLAAQIAKTPQRVQVRTGARTAGVRIVVGRSNSGARGADKGVIRHPVFGNRKVWVLQKVKPGWFSQTLRESAPEVLPYVEAALRRVALQVIQKG